MGREKVEPGVATMPLIKIFKKKLIIFSPDNFWEKPPSLSKIKVVCSLQGSSQHHSRLVRSGIHQVTLVLRF